MTSHENLVCVRLEGVLDDLRRRLPVVAHRLDRRTVVGRDCLGRLEDLLGALVEVVADRLEVGPVDLVVARLEREVDDVQGGYLGVGELGEDLLESGFGLLGAVGGDDDVTREVALAEGRGRFGDDRRRDRRAPDDGLADVTEKRPGDRRLAVTAHHHVVGLVLDETLEDLRVR